METELHVCYICARCLLEAHMCSLVGGVGIRKWLYSQELDLRSQVISESRDDGDITPRQLQKDLCICYHTFPVSNLDHLFTITCTEWVRLHNSPHRRQSPLTFPFFLSPSSFPSSSPPCPCPHPHPPPCPGPPPPFFFSPLPPLLLLLLPRPLLSLPSNKPLPHGIVLACCVLYGRAVI